MKKVICSQKAPGAIGPYSQAIEANGMIFVSGQLPIDAVTGQMAEGAEAQARQSLENIKHILGEKELNGKCGLYAQVTIEPGCSLGYHEHHNESETYYILSGQGDYDDNGTVRPVKTGDVTFTPDNHGHGLKNTGDTDLVFMALIIFD